MEIGKIIKDLLIPQRPAEARLADAKLARDWGEWHSACFIVGFRLRR